MERSIEEARRKRGATDGSSQPNGSRPAEHLRLPNPNGIHSHTSTSPTPTATNTTPPQPALRAPNGAAPTPQNAPHVFSSYVTPGHATPADGNPEQPARLKARPKRWQSASA